MSSPSLLWVTEDGNLAIGDMPNVGGYRGRRAALQPKHTLSLASSELVLEVLHLLIIQSKRLLHIIAAEGFWSRDVIAEQHLENFDVVHDCHFKDLT